MCAYIHSYYTDKYFFFGYGYACQKRVCVSRVQYFDLHVHELFYVITDDHEEYMYL
jgi:hypothetical protein